MSKSVLIILGLVVVSMGGVVQSLEDTAAGNYDNLELFLQSFMDSYTGTAYPMSTCLTPAIQAKLDQILAASVGWMVLLKFDEVMTSYKSFLYNLAISCEMCGLNEIQKSLEAGLTLKGKIWFELNLADNIEKISKMADTFVSQMQANNHTLAGATLGAMTSILVPYIAPTPTPTPTPTPKSLGMYTTFDQTTYQLWWKGMIVSLSINPKKMGPCATFLGGFANNTMNPASDLSMIMSHQWAGFKNVFGDIAGSLTFVQKNYTGSCEFGTLYDNIDALMQKGGAAEILARYATRALSINTAVVNIKNCAENIYSCGQAYGTIIKYMLNWSIN